MAGMDTGTNGKQPDSFKSGIIAVCGRPNVGKSTLVNAIVGQKVAITSDKPQTTRNRIRAIYNEPGCQMVFTDTPGIHKHKNKLGEYMVGAAKQAMLDADAVLFLAEPSTFIGKGEQLIIESLKKVSAPVILVINKTDTVKKEKLLPVADAYRKLFDFQEIIFVSARKKENLKELLNILKGCLPYGPAYFGGEDVTDQPERQMIAEIVREKALRRLGDEIPHGIAVVVDVLKFKHKLATVEATIICEKNSHKPMIIGKNGAKIKEIGTDARIDIERVLDIPVNLRLWVKIKEEWRESDYLVRNFAYTMEKE